MECLLPLSLASFVASAVSHKPTHCIRQNSESYFSFLLGWAGLVFVLIAERRLRVSWNRALRKILRPNDGEVRGGRWRLHTEEGYELWTSHNL